MNSDIKTIAKLDEELVAIIRDFIILGPLSWSKSIMNNFMKELEVGNYILPKITYPKNDYNHKIVALKNFMKKLGKDDHPAIKFMRDTAQSYLYAYYILQGAGTAEVSYHSRLLYGSPKDYLPGYDRRNIDVANYFIRIVEEYKCTVPNEELIYDAPAFKKEMLRHIKRSIDPRKDQINVTIDSKITARATAGPNYVKIRAGTMFSEGDLLQLLHHEVMIHTLTYLNGRKQPILKSLGYAAPRTTATQEGLAVFAEYINMAVDLVRLNRIALRIIAIDMAENGANFVELFKFFLSHGQNNDDSYYSAMRILRGGSAKGGVIFYKDNVYLRGLVEVSSFLKHSMHKGEIHNIALLFAGKLTTQDVTNLQPLIAEGYITHPEYIPHWGRDSSMLAAHLAFNDLTEMFKEADF